MPYFPTDEGKEAPQSPPQSPDLLYEPLEESRGDEFAPTVPPRPVGSSFLFRLNVTVFVLIALVGLARSFWWPSPEPKSEPETEEVAAPPEVTETPAPEPQIVDESEDPGTDEDLTEDLGEEWQDDGDEYQILQTAPVEATVSPEPAAPAPVPEPTAPEEPEEPARVAEQRPAPRQPEPWEAPNQPKGLLRPGPGVSPPIPLDLPRYGYPRAARGTGISTGVRLALLVDEKGRVIDAVVREGAPEGLGFDQVALQAAKKTPFQPATRYDRPGKMWTELILEFVE